MKRDPKTGWRQDDIKENFYEWGGLEFRFAMATLDLQKGRLL
jgi:hypothetical protein